MAISLLIFFVLIILMSDIHTGPSEDMGRCRS